MLTRRRRSGAVSATCPGAPPYLRTSAAQRVFGERADPVAHRPLDGLGGRSGVDLLLERTADEGDAPQDGADRAGSISLEQGIGRLGERLDRHADDADRQREGGAGGV